MDFLNYILNYEDFVARHNCGDWSPAWIKFYMMANAGVFTAYMLIPAAILLNRDNFMELSKINIVRVSFGLFVLICGLGHLEGVVSFYYPAYRAFAVWHFATACVSWWTVIIFTTEGYFHGRRNEHV